MTAEKPKSFKKKMSNGLMPSNPGDADKMKRQTTANRTELWKMLLLLEENFQNRWPRGPKRHLQKMDSEAKIQQPKIWMVWTLVFQSCNVLRYLYELEAHLDRLLRSASIAKIIPPFSRSSLRNILVQTVAVSQCRKGSLRYWLSAGPGDFLLSPSGCPTSSFYAIVIEDDYSPDRKGVKVVTSSIPMKPPQFATTKNVNYLPNALSMMEAEEKGAFVGIWVDDEGYIAEGPHVNVAFISKTNELLVPSFDKILSGCTAKRLLALAPKFVEQGLLTGIRVGNISLKEGKDAAEMMLVGSGLPILPVVMWDDCPIGNGTEGHLSRALSSLLWEDMTSGPSSLLCIPVPYGKYGHNSQGFYSTQDISK